MTLNFARVRLVEARQRCSPAPVKAYANALQRFNASVLEVALVRWRDLHVSLGQTCFVLGRHALVVSLGLIDLNALVVGCSPSNRPINEMSSLSSHEAANLAIADPRSIASQAELVQKFDAGVIFANRVNCLAFPVPKSMLVHASEVASIEVSCDCLNVHFRDFPDPRGGFSAAIDLEFPANERSHGESSEAEPPSRLLIVIVRVSRVDQVELVFDVHLTMVVK